ncbi:MAG: hypothetical protein EBU84_05875 [Actinobacteria bacterium]|nr:hypothetical protein [Actinomycetota bacterium]
MSQQRTTRILWVFSRNRTGQVPATRTDKPRPKRFMTSQDAPIDDDFMNHELARWTADTRSRRRLAVATATVIAIVWAMCVSTINLGWHYLLGMALVCLAAHGTLNYSLRSIFDVSDAAHDERTIALRDSVSFDSYKIAGILIIATLAAAEWGADVTRLWIPAVATYATIPYLLLAWNKVDID